MDITKSLIIKSLWKREFRELFPEVKKDIDNFLQNPGCKCNEPLYNTILQQRDRLRKFFGEEIVIKEKVVTQESLRNNTFVINTTIDNLEQSIKRLPVGPKSISLARFEDKITAVIQILG